MMNKKQHQTHPRNTPFRSSSIPMPCRLDDLALLQADSETTEDELRRQIEHDGCIASGGW